jgi:hypothetical protein
LSKIGKQTSPTQAQMTRKTGGSGLPSIWIKERNWRNWSWTKKQNPCMRSTSAKEFWRSRWPKKRS